MSVETDILNERVFQVNKWGTEEALVKDMGWDNYLKTKCVVLMEEVGEFCKEVLDKRLDEAYTEGIQVAAVARAICEGVAFMMENRNAV